MFNEAESEAKEDRKEPSMGEVKPPASRKKKGHKDQLLKPLPKETISYTLSEEEARCPVCGETLHEMKKEVRKELVVIPAKYIVREHVTYSYACRNCEKYGIEAPVVKAGAKEGLFRNSIASASLVSDIIIKKYQQAQPLYRQEQALRLQGCLQIAMEARKKCFRDFSASGWLIFIKDNGLLHVTASASV